MVYMDSTAILLSNKNVLYADKLRSMLKNKKCELTYASSLIELLNYLTTKNSGCIFIDECFIKFAPFIRELIQDSEFIKNFIFIFVCNASEDEFLHLENKNLYFMPFNKLDFDKIDEIYHVFKDKNINSSYIDTKKLSVDLTKCLMNLGLSQKYIGFNYIKDAIEVIINSNGKMGSLQKNVYPIVALKYNTQNCNIERNIRSVLKDAYQKESMLYNIMKNSSSNGLTNRTFINFIVDHIYNSYNTNKNISIFDFVQNV